MTQTPEMFEGLTPPPAFPPDAVISDLGDGLVLRHGTPDDSDALAAFNETVHADAPSYSLDTWVRHWTGDLMSGRHPRIRAHDFVIVHDSKAERIAATLSLLSHRMRYGATLVDGGQPELVGTHPAYRRRGLVRKMFDVVHGWSADRGEKLQIVDGIPWYYRQFDYEMGIESGVSRLADKALMLAAPPADTLFQARDATPDDIPFLERMYKQTCDRHRLSCVRDAALWRYEFERSPGSAFARDLVIVEDRDGRPQAATACTKSLRAGWLSIGFYEVAPGTPMQALTRTLFTELHRRAEAFAERDGGEFQGANFFLGSEHPLYEVARGRLRDPGRRYALYVRIPDVVDFLTHVAPELEARLAASPFAGQRGSLDLSFYRSGARIVFDAGRIERVESWTPDTGARGDLAFPDLSFLSLLMGHRSLQELNDFYPDCIVGNEQRGALAEVLFPKQPSSLWATY
jgi:hypothetical protein